MTTEKTKAALDALNSLRVDTPDSFVRKHYDIIREILIAQTEAQPADDELREAVEWANEVQGFLDKGNEAVIDKGQSVYIQTLIRATTAPKQTDAEREKALEIFDAAHCDEGVLVFNSEDDIQTVRAALRAPAAVPQEVVEALEHKRLEAIGKRKSGKPENYEFWNGVIHGHEEALALLQQKGG